MVDTLPGSHPISSQEGSSLGISILGPAGGESEGPSLSDPLVSSSLGGGGKLGDAKTTVRVVKRPSTSSIGPFYSKVRIGETGQQFRIVGGQSVGNIVNIGGQPIKIVTAGAGTGAGAGVTGNLKTIVPNESAAGFIGSQANTISVGGASYSGLPGAQHGIKIANSSQMLPNAAGVKIANKPAQQIRILPNQPQTFKILNSDGSFSDISSSFIRPKSDIKTLSSVDSSPKKKGATYTLKSPQKVQGGSGPILKTSDGRIISLASGGKKVLVPGTAAGSSPTKIVFRDADGKTINGSRLVSGVAAPLPQSGSGPQLIRLTPEVATSLASGAAGDNKVQFVRVVGAGAGVHTLQIKGGQPFVTSGQGAVNCKGEFIYIRKIIL